MYGAAPRSLVVASSPPTIVDSSYNEDSTNSMGGTKDASNDFFDYRPKNQRNRVPTPPVVAEMNYGGQSSSAKRPSQFNSNIILGPSSSASPQTFDDDLVDGDDDGGKQSRRPTQYYNNRAMNY